MKVVHFASLQKLLTSTKAAPECISDVHEGQGVQKADIMVPIIVLLKESARQKLKASRSRKDEMTSD